MTESHFKYTNMHVDYVDSDELQTMIQIYRSITVFRGIYFPDLLYNKAPEWRQISNEKRLIIFKPSVALECWGRL